MWPKCRTGPLKRATVWFAKPSLQSERSEIVHGLSDLCSRILSSQILIWMLPTWAASWNGGLQLMSPRLGQRCEPESVREWRCSHLFLPLKQRRRGKSTTDVWTDRVFKSRTCSLVCIGSLQVTHYNVYTMELLDGANCAASSFRNSSISTDGTCSRQYFGTSLVGVENLKLSWQAAHWSKTSIS